MIVSDLGAGMMVLTAAVLYLTGVLQPWMVIPINFGMSAFHSLMWPAYTAAVTLLVPKEQFGRANGFVQLGEALPQVAGPAIAGALYVAIQLGYLALIDSATYLIAVLLMLLFVRIPAPPATAEGHKARGGMLSEMTFGWRYITQRRGLLALLTYFLALNFLSGILEPLFVPLVLDNWDARVLGYLSTTMGAGMLTGTLVMSAWGGGRRKVVTLLTAGGIGSLFLAAMGVRAYIPLLAIGGFGFMFATPILNASSQAIWQVKVAPDVQGRVFAIRRAIAWSTMLIAPLLAAPLADHIFKPAMAAGGALEPLLGPILGSGANRGIGVLVMVLGLSASAVSFLAFGSRAIRNVESDLPDHVGEPEPIQAPAVGAQES
jgi:MFS family permease